MRLLLITNVFPRPNQPNKGVFNLDMVRALARDHDIHVVSPISWVDEGRERWKGKGAMASERRAVIDGIEIRYPRFFYPPKVLRAHYGRFLWLSTRGTIRRMLKAHPPDVVLGYWVHPDGEVAVRAAREAGVPSVILEGGSSVLVLSRDPSRRRCIQRVLQSASAVVTVSHDLRSKVIELGIASGAIHVVNRGVDVSIFSPGERAEARRRLGIPVEGRVLVWIGRMVHVKGLDILLEACSFLHARGVKFRLYLVGSGPLQQSLEAESRSRGLSGIISFVGQQSHKQLPDWYRAADLTLLPSRSEGIPNVLRESLACGTPFVASHVGGIPELSGEPWGRLVPPENPVALAEAVARGLSEPTPAEPPRLPGWGEAAESMLQIFRSLVPAPPGREAIVGLLPDDPIAHLP